MIWLTLIIISIFTILGWIIFKGADSFGFRLLLTMSVSGLAFWVMTATWLVCEVSGCQ